MDRQRRKSGAESFLSYFESLGVKTPEEAILHVQNDLEGAAVATGLSASELIDVVERLEKSAKEAGAETASSGELRDLRPEDLTAGSIYFLFGFLDREGIIPSLATLVFVGKDLHAGDQGLYYFEDAKRLGPGKEYADVGDSNSAMIATATLNGIYDFDGAIRLLLECKARRSRRRRSSRT